MAPIEILEAGQPNYATLHFRNSKYSRNPTDTEKKSDFNGKIRLESLTTVEFFNAQVLLQRAHTLEADLNMNARRANFVVCGGGSVRNICVAAE